MVYKTWAKFNKSSNSSVDLTVQTNLKASIDKCQSLLANKTIAWTYITKKDKHIDSSMNASEVNN
ncbi:hypothetical protein BpHYR1_019120 [Brachionus plicatilis]|uniref:Uncharacterized protein n=1 Tax=Brachionus plicatilis TaxID=10195 RepID=A0A3M7SD37_BRAPC|nr:hypothetical protein BpHYR1_019120 [Brachionus plicatilis]